MSKQDCTYRTTAMREPKVYRIMFWRLTGTEKPLIMSWFHTCGPTALPGSGRHGLRGQPRAVVGPSARRRGRGEQKRTEVTAVMDTASARR